MLSNKRIKHILLWFFLVVLALIFLSANIERSKSWNPVAGVLVEILSPVQKLVKGCVDFTAGLWSKYIWLINTHDENIRLKSEVDRLVMENTRYKVIGRDPTGWFRSIIIDKGENSGIREGMPVVNAMGVVGQIVSVSYNYSKVLLVIDQNSAVDCIIERSRDSGIVKGMSSKICTLDYVLKTSDVRVGDLVITSGLDRIFPKGIHVGEVIEVKDAPEELFKNTTALFSKVLIADPPLKVPEPPPVLKKEQ